MAPDALQSVLGSDVVQQISAKTGLPIAELLPQIAQHLPVLVDGMTPNGQLRSADYLLQAGLSFLRGRAALQT